MQNITLYVSGIHCASCKILITEILQEQIGLHNIHNIQVDLKQQKVSFKISFQNNMPANIEQLIKTLNENAKFYNYIFSETEIKSAEIFETNKLFFKIKKNYVRFFLALIIGLSILIVFFLLQKSQILNMNFVSNNEQPIQPMTSFIFGLIASVSSCLAVVGGLVLSLSAKLAEEGKESPLQDSLLRRTKKNKKIFYFFHVGRFLSFAILGGFLGLFGSHIFFNSNLQLILGMISSLIMILVAFNLLGFLQHFLPKNIFIFSPKFFRFFKKIEHQIWTPVLIGIGTFFLPCGFTQSMQLVALSSQSFFAGSAIMFFYALGTFPMLAFLSFGSASFVHSKYSKLFLESAALVILGFGIFTFLNSLVGLGIINPFLNF